MSIMLEAELQDIAGADHRRSPERLIEGLPVQAAELRREVVNGLWLRCLKGPLELATLSDVGADKLKVAVMAEIAAPDLVTTLAQLAHKRAAEGS
jgi:hypothetical protein